MNREKHLQKIAMQYNLPFDLEPNEIPFNSKKRTEHCKQNHTLRLFRTTKRNPIQLEEKNETL